MTKKNYTNRSWKYSTSMVLVDGSVTNTRKERRKAQRMADKQQKQVTRIIYERTR